MAVPIILGAVALGSAAYGAYKGVKGVSDKREASKVDSRARGMVDRANEAVEDQRESTNERLTDYGLRKLRAFNEQIPAFIATFERLKNVDLNQSIELDKLNQGDFSVAVLSELKIGYEMLKASGVGLVAGATGGAATAFGAYSGTMMLAAASTGTPISALSGVAATNATLAWLGGGSLATGGLGMAGGTMVLGGMVAGPALAILGHFVGNAGEEALNKARGNLEQAQTVQEQSALMVKKLKAVEDVTTLANKAFSRINRELRRAVEALQETIDTQGEDYATFDQGGKESVFRSATFALLVKAMIDTPILDEAGNLVLSTQKARTIKQAADETDVESLLTTLVNENSSAVNAV